MSPGAVPAVPKTACSVSVAAAMAVPAAPAVVPVVAIAAVHKTSAVYYAIAANVTIMVVVEMQRKLAPFLDSMRRFPISRVTMAVPLRTISMMVFHPLGVSLSKGEMKFPAALLMTTSGRPTVETR